MTPSAGVATIGSCQPACEPTMDDRNLLDVLREGLPLTRRPFEAIGRACGASEDEVLEYLRRGHADGTLSDAAPLPPTLADASPLPAPDDFDQRLLAVIASGLPLLPTPYDAIAASLEATEAEVIG